MLRLILLASLSLVSGCSCDALWGAYEVPCTRGFDCPDAAMSENLDMAPRVEEDLTGTSGNGDGPSVNPDMGMTGVELGTGGGFDLGMTTNDMIIVGGRLDLDIIK